MNVSVGVLIAIVSVSIICGAAIIALEKNSSDSSDDSNTGRVVTQPYEENIALSSSNCSEGVTVDIEKVEGTNRYTATIRYGEDTLTVSISMYRTITGDKIDPGYNVTFRVIGHDGLLIKNLRDSFFGDKLASWTVTDNASYSGKMYVSGFDVEFQTSGFLTKKAGFTFSPDANS